MSFTAHNIRLADGSYTIPETTWVLADEPWVQAALRCLRLLYRGQTRGRSIVDLGCLEGGYAAEFARMGMDTLGIEVRQSNFENCLVVQNGMGLANLRFVKDDVQNLANHGQFNVSFCCGLLYHLDNPVEFIRSMAAVTSDAIILNTHYAPESESEVFALSPLTENEGMPGRWFAEHDAETTADLEAIRWASWSNKRSFWLTKPALMQCLQNEGFDIVFEQMDHVGASIKDAAETGYYSKQSRTMIVGVRSSVL